MFRTQVNLSWGRFSVKLPPSARLFLYQRQSVDLFSHRADIHQAECLLDLVRKAYVSFLLVLKQVTMYLVA
jgi:hypothetical protein